MKAPFLTGVYPVIHWQSTRQALDMAHMCFKHNADGVFLIDMSGGAYTVNSAGVALRREYPGKIVGANYLAFGVKDAIKVAYETGLNAVWLDHAGVDSSGIKEDGHEGWTQSEAIRLKGVYFSVFAACAFKTQRFEPDPVTAAKTIKSMGWIPTTSGPGTGRAAKAEKVKMIADAVRPWHVGLASGVTPENAPDYLGSATCFLAATGIEKSFGVFDEERLKALVDIVRSKGAV